MKYNDFFEMLDDIGLTIDEYDAMLVECHQMTEGIIPRDWQSIVDKYHLPWQPDSVRRAFTSPFLGGSAVYDYCLHKKEKDKIISPDVFKLYEIKKEKQKLQDVRTAINKKARETARLEEDLRFLQKCIQETNYYPYYEVKEIVQKEEAMIVCLSDIHFGLDVENGFGKYNENIVERYLNNYLNKIKELKNLHNIDICYLLLLGDLISGNIHPTVQLQNRENAIAQSQKVAELLSSFVYELGKMFGEVYVNGVAGNHSRIGFKDDVLRNERLDNIVPWYMKAKLSNFENIKFIDDKNYDDTIGQFQIQGNYYWAVHGDFDNLNENGISKLVMMFGYKPSGLFMGHLHKCEYTEVAGIPLIRSGSFCGTVDDYTIKKRISGIPSQMITIVNDDGVKCCYPINLEK